MYDNSTLGELLLQRLSMVVANYPDISQHNMNDLFHGF